MPGPEFFETGMGRKFFECDVPRLAKALERIADALEANKHPESENITKSWVEEAISRLSK